MGTNISVKAATYLTKKFDYDSDTYEKLKYGFTIVYQNLTKLFIFIIITGLLGILKYSLILLCAYSLTRLFAFGAHLNSSFKCTIFSLIIFICGTYVGIYAPSNIIVIYSILGICFLLAAIYAPAATEKRPINDLNRKKFKIKTLLMITIQTSFALYFGASIISNLIVIGVILEIINILPITGKLLIKL